MIKKLDAKEIEKVIQNNMVGRLGCHSGNKTYVVPISYAYDGESIYCHTYEGQKISMMRKNPEVCFQIEEMENMANWKSVIGWGKFEELTDKKQRGIGLKKLMERIPPEISSETLRLTPEWPFPAKDYNRIDGIVFRIRFTEKTGRSEIQEKREYFK